MYNVTEHHSSYSSGKDTIQLDDSCVLIFESIHLGACTTSVKERDCGKFPNDILAYERLQNPQKYIKTQLHSPTSVGQHSFLSLVCSRFTLADNNNSAVDLLQFPGASSVKVLAGNCPVVEKGGYMTVSEWKDLAGLNDHGNYL